MTYRVTIYRTRGDANPIEVFAEEISEADRLVALLVDAGVLAVLEVGHMEWSR